MISLREAFGHALVQIAKDRDFVVLDADVSGGTNTNFFKEKFPKRFIQCGIAEQNMMSVASGLTNSGLIPIVAAYGVFATLRPLDQIRNSIAYPRSNVKIVASHIGVDAGQDGATHQSIEDIAVMRCLPNMVVISPCDETEILQAALAMIDYQGPVYMRSGRSPVPKILPDNYKFEIGKASVLKQGTSVIVIFATGIMVHRALEASKENNNATVINISTIKPLDRETVIAYAKKSRKAIICEDHSIIGGLGSAIAEVLSEENINTELVRIGINDKFGMSGEPSELANLYGISSESIKHEINN